MAVPPEAAAVVAVVAVMPCVVAVVAPACSVAVALPVAVSVSVVDAGGWGAVRDSRHRAYSGEGQRETPGIGAYTGEGQ